jgi:hypothetical protein
MSDSGNYELGPDPDESEHESQHEPEPDLFADEPEPEGPPLVLIGGISLLAIVLLVASFFVLRGCGGPEPKPAPVPPSLTTPTPVAATPEPTPEPIELPPLDDSDELIRQLAAALSAHPELSAWLAQPHLVRMFVAAVDNVAEGASPARVLRFWKPATPFIAGETRAGARLDTGSYSRYDVVGAVAQSLDAEGCVRFYRQIEPLTDAAYAELGYQDRDFEDTLRRAIDVLLGAPIVLEQPMLTRRVLAWRFVDAELESLPEAQKHLVRMGPENTRRVQAKLRAIAEALGPGGN